MLTNPFRTPTLHEQLARELEELKVARVGATAQVAYWINRELFLRTETQRVSTELGFLDDAEGQQVHVVGETFRFPKVSPPD